MSGDHDGKPAPGDRGLYDFAQITDTYGSEIRVRTSTAAWEPCVWRAVHQRRG